MTTTTQQKQEKAKQYLQSKNISFGSQIADDCAIEIFVAGMQEREDVYLATIKEFKDAYIQLFKFHCEEIIKKFGGNEKSSIDLSLAIKNSTI